MATDSFGRSPFRSCPTCTSPLAEHEFLDLCQAPMSEKQEERIERLVDEERWRDLTTEAGERQTAAGCVLRALRCPIGTGAVVPQRLCASVYEDDEICGMVYQLDDRSVAHLVAQLSGPEYKWLPYTATWLDRHR